MEKNGILTSDIEGLLLQSGLDTTISNGYYVNERVVDGNVHFTHNVGNGSTYKPNSQPEYLYRPVSCGPNGFWPSLLNNDRAQMIRCLHEMNAAERPVVSTSLVKRSRVNLERSLMAAKALETHVLVNPTKAVLDTLATKDQGNAAFSVALLPDNQPTWDDYDGDIRKMSRELGVPVQDYWPKRMFSNEATQYLGQSYFGPLKDYASPTYRIFMCPYSLADNGITMTTFNTIQHGKGPPAFISCSVDQSARPYVTQWRGPPNRKAGGGVYYYSAMNLARAFINKSEWRTAVPPLWPLESTFPLGITCGSYLDDGFPFHSDALYFIGSFLVSVNTPDELFIQGIVDGKLRPLLRIVEGQAWHSRKLWLTETGAGIVRNRSQLQYHPAHMRAWQSNDKVGLVAGHSYHTGGGECYDMCPLDEADLVAVCGKTKYPNSTFYYRGTMWHVLSPIPHIPTLAGRLGMESHDDALNSTLSGMGVSIQYVPEEAECMAAPGEIITIQVTAPTWISKAVTLTFSVMTPLWKMRKQLAGFAGMPDAAYLHLATVNSRLGITKPLPKSGSKQDTETLRVLGITSGDVLLATELHVKKYTAHPISNLLHCVSEVASYLDGRQLFALALASKALCPFRDHALVRIKGLWDLHDKTLTEYPGTISKYLWKFRPSLGLYDRSTVGMTPFDENNSTEVVIADDPALVSYACTLRGKHEIKRASSITDLGASEPVGKVIMGYRPGMTCSFEMRKWFGLVAYYYQRGGVSPQEALQLFRFNLYCTFDSIAGLADGLGSFPFIETWTGETAMAPEINHPPYAISTDFAAVFSAFGCRDSSMLLYDF